MYAVCSFSEHAVKHLFSISFTDLFELCSEQGKCEYIPLAYGMIDMQVPLCSTMNDDKRNWRTYAWLMAKHHPFITVTIDLQQPIEIHNFVGMFVSLGDQFEQYVRREHPDSPIEAKIYVKEVRAGSIVADLFASSGGLIDLMGATLTVLGFAALFSGKISAYINGQRDPDASKSDLSDFMGTVRAVSEDSNGKAILETATYSKGVLTKKVALTFTTSEAKNAVASIEQHKSEIDALSATDYSRVLMYFKRSDIGDAALGRRSGERVIIEGISDKDMPLIYASRMAEDRIKDEMRNTDENIFRKGFVVDVNVQSRAGKPMAYSVTNVHQVIDLPDESDS